MIQRAIKNSLIDSKIPAVSSIPSAKTYYPSAEEFQNPLKYVEKIRQEAERFGICKIVPPKEWNPPTLIDFNSNKEFPTRKQKIHNLQEGKGFTDSRQYTMQQYKDMADEFTCKWKKEHYSSPEEATFESLARDYWKMVETGSPQVDVEYANDIDTMKVFSGFSRVAHDENWTGVIEPAAEVASESFSPEFYGQTGWNLNNIAAMQGSVLRYVKTSINGINVPWLYVGMLFATFCWHTEDNYFYSINYSHMGAPKQWYGVPSDAYKVFEKVAKQNLLEAFLDSPDLLHYMTTQLSPYMLLRNNVPVYCVTQEPRTFIVTFPRAYHAGFSYGFNVNEAVNFATYEWLPFGAAANEIYRRHARHSVLSHVRLLFTLAHHIALLQEDTRATLAAQILDVVNEELSYRAMMTQYRKTDLPPNNFAVIDQRASDYDELRDCDVCKHTCILSAFACSCNRQKVVCMRHSNQLCKCGPEKQYLLVWASYTDLQLLQAQAEHLIKSKQRLLVHLPPELNPISFYE